MYVSVITYLLPPYLTDLTDVYTFGWKQVVTPAGVLGSYDNSSYMHQLFPLSFLINKFPLERLLSLQVILSYYTIVLLSFPSLKRINMWPEA